MEAELGSSKRSLVLVFRKHVFHCASVDLAQPGGLWVKYGLHGSNMHGIPSTYISGFGHYAALKHNSCLYMLEAASSSHFHHSELEGLKERENLLLLLGVCISVLPS